MMNAFIACLAACLLHEVCSTTTPVSWCYHRPSCSDAVWPIIAEKDCDGTQQSPIDIVTANVQANTNLTAFTFTGYNDRSTLTEIKNTGRTIEVTLGHKKMYVEGGDLPGLFTSTQFHLHWGNGSATPGSEHGVNGKRYPMELHIVNKAEGNGSDPVFAVFGIFIEASNDTGKPESWKTLTSYLAQIASAGDKTHVSDKLTMDDLLPRVDRTQYYRYLGSLTTPNCDEGVIWTIFKDSVKVSQDLIDLFTTTVYINQTTDSPLMTNTFRAVQPIHGRIVMSQVAGPKTTGLIKPTSGTKTTGFVGNPTTGLIKPTSGTKTTGFVGNPTTGLITATSGTKTTGFVGNPTTGLIKPTSGTKTTGFVGNPTTGLITPTSVIKTTNLTKLSSAATNPSLALSFPLSVVLLYCILPS